MNKNLAGICIVLFLCLGLHGKAFAYETLYGGTELRYWDEDRAFYGYTLFASRGTSYLIDMEGNLVHTWPIGTNPRLLEYNGHLLDAATDDPSGFAGFMELDWDGNTIWEYRENREDYLPHHDFVRIYNPKLEAYTTLYIANKTVTHEQCIAAGCDPAHGPYNGAQMDAIVEVDMEGNIVWEWWFFDHVVQDVDPSKENYVGEGNTIADFPGHLDLNLPGRPVKRDWLHCNSLDYNQALDQIVINSVQGEFYVIDHGNTFLPGDPAGSIELASGDAGDFLYRFGDPARYEQGDPPSFKEDWTQTTTGHKQIGGAHDVQWIRPGLPGEGHFLIFNNGQYLFERTPQSYIFEINGFLKQNGQEDAYYINPPDAGYYVWEVENRDTHKGKKNMSNQLVWIYSSKNNHSFFSHIGSGAQRLPNGNTLICAMTEGHLFEVTAEGELVWEYINPVTNQGILTVMPDNYPQTNAVFRAYRYAPDHPAFDGRDMSSSGPITEQDNEPNPDGDTDLPGGDEEIMDGDWADTEDNEKNTDGDEDLLDVGEQVDDTLDGDCQDAPCDCVEGPCDCEQESCNCSEGGGGGCQSAGATSAGSAMAFIFMLFALFYRKRLPIVAIMMVMLIGCSGSGGSSNDLQDGDVDDSESTVNRAFEPVVPLTQKLRL